MKLYHTALLATIILLLTGCFGQDTSDCDVEKNLVLRFGTTDGNAAALASKVDCLDAVVYDQNGLFVDHRRVAKNGQNRLPDALFSVAPGEYRVVCWGNVGENTKVAGIDEKLPIDQAYLETISAATGDKLYYAPHREPSELPATRVAGDDSDIYKATVHSGQVTVKEMTFVRAHRTLTVYLKSYEAVHEAAAPSIRLNHIPMRSDFFLRTFPARKSFESVSRLSTDGRGQMFAWSCNTLIVPITDEMTIEVVKASTAEIVTTVNLREYVEQNSDKINDLDEFSVEISYLMNGMVEIAVPDWGSTPIDPEW